MGDDLDAFPVTATVRIREAREADLLPLEWSGEFRAHRELIRDAWRRHQAGEVVMLVAAIGDDPIGQAWLDLSRRSEGVALVWAVRVRSAWRGRGVGARLMRACERVVAARGLSRVEVGVEKWNADARRLYERLGYVVVGERSEPWGYTDEHGHEVRLVAEQWVLEKTLAGEEARR